MDGKQATVSEYETKKRKHTKLPNIVEPGFVAPDGGWGWMIVIASGFSNFCILSLILSYGLIFRSWFEQLGINLTQATTISNVNNAVMSCVGLSNGPLFRNYSCRQVSCFGSFLCAVSVCVLSFMNTFYGVLICFSIFHAIGSSLAMASCALALNTYFKKKRRLAVGLAWTCTGLAPIVIPQLVTLLLPIYDVNGTVLLFGGIIFNAFACALLLQPVRKHVKKESECEEIEPYAQIDAIKKNNNEMSGTLQNGSSKALSMDNVLHNGKTTHVVRHRLSQFGSQYLSYDDDEQGAMGIDLIVAGTPMISRANDGWYSKLNSSNLSLPSNKTINRECPRQTKGQSTAAISQKESSLMTSNRLNDETNGLERRNSNQTNVAETIAEDHYENTDNHQKQKIDDDVLLSKGDDMTESLLGLNTLTYSKKYNELKETKKSWYRRAWHAFAIFFDLDLLQDPVYVNIMIGINFLNFADINSFALMPFILGDYGLEQADAANIMSVLAIVDVISRLSVPLIASRMGWENRTFYMLSVAILVTGRTLLAHLRTYNLLMATSVLIGTGKAFRQIFVALVIPDHIPLERLPAATGLQVAFAGITYLIFGPVVGWIRDICGDYTLTLHFLNLFAYLVVISWLLEFAYFSIRQKRLDRNKDILP